MRRSISIRAYVRWSVRLLVGLFVSWLHKRLSHKIRSPFNKRAVSSLSLIHSLACLIMHSFTHSMTIFIYEKMVFLEDASLTYLAFFTGMQLTSVIRMLPFHLMWWFQHMFRCFPVAPTVSLGSLAVIAITYCRDIKKWCCLLFQQLSSLDNF